MGICRVVCCLLQALEALCQSPNSNMCPGMFSLRGPTDFLPLGYMESSVGNGATVRDLAEEVLMKWGLYR